MGYAMDAGIKYLSKNMGVQNDRTNIESRIKMNQKAINALEKFEFTLE